MKTALVIRHTPCEGIAGFRDPIEAAGFAIDRIDVTDPSFPDQDFIAPDLLVMMGGPMAVYERAHHPWIRHEIERIAERIAAAEAAGIDRSRIAADPGIGFGKTMEHTLAHLANLSLLHGLGVPLLIGASRKRFIGGIAGGETAQSREAGSFAIALVAAAQGAQILRVHDAAGTRQALSVWLASVSGTGA